MVARQKKRGPKRNSALKAFVFFVGLLVLMLLSLLVPLRPTTSEAENRDLEAFPDFSWQALSSGTYFQGIDAWFSDTFPLRDMFFSIKESITSLYGYRGDGEISGTIKKADKIPDKPFAGE